MLLENTDGMNTDVIFTLPKPARRAQVREKFAAGDEVEQHVDAFAVMERPVSASILS
jgi:hypothetical protein